MRAYRKTTCVINNNTKQQIFSTPAIGITRVFICNISEMGIINLLLCECWGFERFKITQPASSGNELWVQVYLRTKFTAGSYLLVTLFPGDVMKAFLISVVSLLLPFLKYKYASSRYELFFSKYELCCAFTNLTPWSLHTEEDHLGEDTLLYFGRGQTEPGTQISLPERYD